MQYFKTPGTEVFRTRSAYHYSRATVGNEPVSLRSLHLYLFLSLPSLLLTLLLFISFLPPLFPSLLGGPYVFSGLQGYPGFRQYASPELRAYSTATRDIGSFLSLISSSHA